MLRKLLSQLGHPAGDNCKVRRRLRAQIIITWYVPAFRDRIRAIHEYIWVESNVNDMKPSIKGTSQSRRHKRKEEMRLLAHVHHIACFSYEVCASGLPSKHLLSNDKT